MTEKKEVKILIGFSDVDWAIVMNALHVAGGELAASEARKTGGRGFGEGDEVKRLGDIHKISNEIYTQMKLAEKAEDE